MSRLETGAQPSLDSYHRHMEILAAWKLREKRVRLSRYLGFPLTFRIGVALK